MADRSKVDKGRRRAIGVSLLISFTAAALLMLPAPSGIGPMTLTDWHDQSVFLGAVVQSDTGLPEPRLRELVGPAYIALARIVAGVAGLNAAAALLLLSRLTLFAIAAMMTVALRDRARTGPSFQILLAAVTMSSLATSVWFHFSDIPWTHFVAAALLSGMVLVSQSGITLAIRSALIGALSIALVQTRLFEAMVAGIAALMIAPLAIWRYRARLSGWRQGLGQIALPAVAGAGFGFVAIALLSHNWSLYQQYSSQPGLVMSFGLLPTKAIQLFWDTCYSTICAYAEAPRTGYFADSLGNWRQPLLLQLPGLFGAAAGLIVLLAFRPGIILRLPLGSLFAMLTAGGLVLAYASGAPSGSPHLKYGFFRDFIPAMVLLTTVFVALLARQRVAERDSASTLLPLIVFFMVVVSLTALRPVGLPRIAGSEVSRFEISSTCDGGQCGFELTARDAAGETMPYNDLAYVTCQNGSDFAKTLKLSELRVSSADCASVSVIPVASGLVYTPEGDGFLREPLDLTLPTDTAVVPPTAASSTE